jgi:putative flippase GtrA
MDKAAQQAFVRFLMAGGAAAGANWVAGRLLSPVLGLDAAVVTAYGVGMATAFLLNRAFVFARSGRPPQEEFVRFALVNVVSAAIVWAVTVALARFAFPAIGFTWRAEAVAHAIGIAAPILPSYLLHRGFSFAPRPDARP